MASYRDVLNDVLTGLGEDTLDSGLSTLSSKYHKILALYMNQIKEIIEDTHNWRALQQTLPAVVPAASDIGPVTNASTRARLVRVHDEIRGEEVPLVFDVTDATNPYRMREMDLAEIKRRGALTTQGVEKPLFFAMDILSDALSLHIHPAATTQRTISVTVVNPQDKFANDGDLDDSITIPTGPLVHGTLWYALEERGEELGVNGLFNEETFNRALGAAVARDSAEQGGYNLVPV